MVFVELFRSDVHRLEILTHLATGTLISTHDESCSVGVIAGDWIEIDVSFDLLKNIRQQSPFGLLLSTGRSDSDNAIALFGASVSFALPVYTRLFAVLK
jgi:hypothetical protein